MILAPEAVFEDERREVAMQPGHPPLTIHHPLMAAKGSVLLIPGWSGTRSGPAEIMSFLASALARAGWTALRLDLPGRGDATGAFAACDLDQMIACAADVLRAQAGGAAHLIGLCSGGNVALGLSSLEEFHGRALSVVALSTLPFQPARSEQFERRRRWRNFKHYAALAASPKTWARLARGEINLGRVKQNLAASEKPSLGERNLKDSRRDIERELLSWQGRALFVWGGGDEEAPLARAHFEKLHAAGMGARNGVAFHSVPGANHNFYAQPWRQEVAKKVLGFL
jgi:pimeloyl-ACP methyl ester carboxylesterase